MWAFEREGNSVGVWGEGCCEVSAEVRTPVPREEMGRYLLSEWMSERESE